MTALSASIRTDPEGYLIDPADWSEDIARTLAGGRAYASPTNTGR